MAGELELAAILCTLVFGGETEARHDYSLSHIYVDCETDTAVVEVGLDKRSSLDSVQQAMFAGYLTGKDPVVVIIDTDGREGPFELRVRTVADLAGIAYRTYRAEDLLRHGADAARSPVPAERPKDPDTAF